MDPYCQANYNCSQTEIWSDSGCYTFEASPQNPDCHLYCETDYCPYLFDPAPAYCVVYTCSRFSNSTTTTTEKPTTVPLSPIEPAVPVCESSFWTPVSIITGSTLSILLVCLAVPAIVLLWRKVRRTSRQGTDVESGSQNVALLSELYLEQSEQPRQHRRWFRRSRRQYRPPNNEQQSTPPNVQSEQQVQQSSPPPVVQSQQPPQQLEKQSWFWKKKPAAATAATAGSPDQNTALLSCPTSSIVSNAVRQQNSRCPNWFKRQAQPSRPHSVHVPLSIINPNANFSLASTSSSSSSLESKEQETTFHDVALDEDSFFVKDTIISLIPTHLPKVTSVMCFNHDQLLAALLMQRCQLLLWLAEVYEQEAVNDTKCFAVK